MAVKAYYNEIDPHAAQWLRNLIAADVIAPGVVDERDVRDVEPDDLKDFAQCHFFSGIGVWSYTLRQAGWEDSRRIWTGSCPCFPEGVLVLTKRGYLPIEQVVVGDRVLTHRARWRRVSHIGSEYGSTVVLKGQGHVGLHCTPAHPFLTPGDAWTPAGEMAGQRWATVACVPADNIPPLLPMHNGYFFDKTVNGFRVKGEKDGRPVYIGVYPTAEEARAARSAAIKSGAISVRGAERTDTSSLGFARFLGFWVGNGWASDASVVICDAIDDVPRLQEIMEGALLPATISIERTTSRARCGSQSLAAWLKAHFGSGAQNKKIPAWLHGAGEKYRAAFLAGYFEADGCSGVQKNGRKIFQFTTTSWALAVGIRVLLNQQRMSVSITRSSPVRETTIEGRRVSEIPFYQLRAHETARSFRFDDTHGWGLVRSVRNSIVRRVYNLSVEEDESYTADGIVVHNCQSFSAAGKRAGFADERHLWPAFFHLIEICRPPVVFGEQVASKDGLAWLDLVLADLEGADYACGAFDLCAASVGAPQIRQRLFFVGHSERLGAGRDAGGGFEAQGRAELRAIGDDAGSSGATGILAGAEGERLQRRQDDGDEGRRQRASGQGCEAGELGDASGAGLALGSISDERRGALRHEGPAAPAPSVEGRHGPTNGFWRDADWIGCTDGKWRPVMPGSFPLASRTAFDLGSGGAFENKSRAKMLKGYGNSIVAPLATEFIKAAMECMP